MALLHRALLAWFVSLVFLILLVLQLDHRMNWSWFLVLIPLWFWDGIVIILFILHFISVARQQHMHTRRWCFCEKLFFNMSPMLLKITLQFILCSRLDNPTASMPLYYVFIPLWLLLSAAIVRLTRLLFPISTE